MPIEALVNSTAQVIEEAAGWLLLGLVAAGLIRALLPMSLAVRLFGGRGLLPIGRAAVLGAPLPLCSCGVLPVAASLRQGGASRGVTASFLTATPETGVDSIALSYALLGPFMAVARPVAAIFSGIVSGVCVELFGGAERAVSKNTTSGDCCDDDSCGETASEGNGKPGLLNSLRYAFTDLLDDLAIWLAIGVLVAGVLQAFVEPQALAGWGGGSATMLLMLVAGIPFYVCATASTPVAAALLAAGVSPGAAMVFMLAGPATNVATIGVLRRQFGVRAAGVYLASVSASALAVGFATDALAGMVELNIIAQLGEGAEILPRWFSLTSAALLVFLSIRPLRQMVGTLVGRSARFGRASKGGETASDPEIAPTPRASTPSVGDE